ncbi:MAG: DUF2969 domain-containing protein [Streptococcaceae bacterium]|jgi:hypothetical protein|nr:DUF2969 domain-containing protein [Streptococcaceae bacterium]
MSKRNKEIEVLVSEKEVIYKGKSLAGLSVKIGKKEIAEVVEIDGKFAVLKQGKLENLVASEDAAVNQAILNYNLG